MASKTRLYKVTTPKGVRLIEAANVQRAVSFVVKDEIVAVIPAQHDIYAMASAGIKIEQAGDEPISDETRSAVAQSDLVAGAIA